MRGLEVLRRIGLWFPIKKWTVFLGTLVGGTFALLVFATAAAHAGDGELTTGSSTPPSTVTEIADGPSGEVRVGDAGGGNEAPEPKPATPGEGVGEKIPADDVNSVVEESVSAAPADGAERASAGKTDGDDIVDDAEDVDVVGSEPPADAEPPVAAPPPKPPEPPEPAVPSPDEAVGDVSAGAGHAEASGEVWDGDAVDGTVDDAEDGDVAGSEPPADAEPPVAAPPPKPPEPPELPEPAKPAVPSLDEAVGDVSAGAGQTEASGEVRDGNASGEDEAPEPEPATAGEGAGEEIPAGDINSVVEESVSAALADGAERASAGKTDGDEIVDEASGDGSAGAGQTEASDPSVAARAGDEESDLAAAEDFSSPDAHSEGEHPSRDGVGAPVGESSASGPVTLGAEPDVVPATWGSGTFMRTAGPGDEPSSRLPGRAGAIPTQPRSHGGAFASSAEAACAAGMSTSAPKAGLDSGRVTKADGESLSVDRRLQLGQPWWSILSWLSPAPPDSPVLCSPLYVREGEMAQPSSGLWVTAIPAAYGDLFAPDVFRGVVAHDQARLRDSPHGVPERPG